MSEVLQAQEGGQPVLVATLIAAREGAALGSKLLVRRDGSTLGTTSVDALDRALAEQAADLLRRRTVSTLRFDAEGRPAARGSESHAVMIEVHERPARLLIAGGGHVGKALSVVASMCGFRVTVVDDRPEWANDERFPEAEQVIRGHFDEVLRGYPIDGNTYVVCVTRGHRHDEISLRETIGRGAAYVGMIGSRRRAAAVLRHVVDEGSDAAAAAEVRTPIGLDIGADTPEEIAVAIMAEIIAVRRGGSGRPMSERRRAK